MRSSLLYDVACIFAGQATRPVLIVFAAVATIVWMGMDVPMFIDWLIGKLASNELPFPI